MIGHPACRRAAFLYSTGVSNGLPMSGGLSREVSAQPAVQEVEVGGVSVVLVVAGGAWLVDTEVLLLVGGRGMTSRLVGEIGFPSVDVEVGGSNDGNSVVDGEGVRIDVASEPVRVEIEDEVADVVDSLIVSVYVDVCSDVPPVVVRVGRLGCPRP